MKSLIIDGKVINEAVFILNTPPLQADVKKYSLSELLDLNIRICVLDVTNLSSPENLAVPAKRMNVSWINVIKPKSYCEVDNFIQEKSKNTIFFPFFDPIYKFRRIYSSLSRNNATYVYVNNACGDFDFKTSNGKNPISLNERIKIHKGIVPYLRQYIYHKAIRKISIKNKAFCYFFAGKNREDELFNNGAVGKLTKKAYIHSWDYERYLGAEKYKYESKYCVFLDQFAPFHSDNAQTGETWNAKNYYDNLRAFFNYIKDNYGYEVIIAAHPRSDYSGDRKWCYQNFRIEYGLTADLVKGSIFVLAECSQSVAMAVMGKKPLIILRNPEIQKNKRFDNAAQAISKILNCPMIEKPEALKTNMLSDYDKEAYNKFWNDYIGLNGNDGKPIWQDIFDKLNE